MRARWLSPCRETSSVSRAAVAAGIHFIVVGPAMAEENKETVAPWPEADGSIARARATRVMRVGSIAFTRFRGLSFIGV
jgi:hypothetical protein